MGFEIFRLVARGARGGVAEHSGVGRPSKEKTQLYACPPLGPRCRKLDIFPNASNLQRERFIIFLGPPGCRGKVCSEADRNRPTPTNAGIRLGQFWQACARHREVLCLAQAGAIGLRTPGLSRLGLDHPRFGLDGAARICAYQFTCIKIRR